MTDASSFALGCFRIWDCLVAPHFDSKFTLSLRKHSLVETESTKRDLLVESFPANGGLATNDEIDMWNFLQLRFVVILRVLISHTGTTMVCSQRSTECLHCICNNIATEHARSSTVRIYYICIIDNGYTAFARSALYTQNARHSAIGPSYWQQLLAIANQPT